MIRSHAHLSFFSKTPINLRRAAQMFAMCACLLLASPWTWAQTSTFAPVNLAYGVPTGTTAVPPDTYPASASESVTVNIIGASPSSPVTFGTTTVSGPNAADFILAGDSCGGQTFTAASVCTVTLYFNASLAPATTLETATLTISPSTGNLVVPLSGAYGSIKVFNEANVSMPPGSTSFSNLYSIATNTLNLSCPSTPTGTLSGTPDGLGNVLVDNYLTLATGSSGSPLTPVTGIESNYPPGNLCSGTGATENSVGDDPYFNCFTESYELAASFNFPVSVVGLDPDTFTNSPNNVLPQGNAGGVPPIPVASFLTSGMQQDSFTLLSSGSATENYYGASTLFLATSCNPGGLVPGGTVTGNPTPVNNACFDSNTGANLCLLDNSGQNPPPTGTTPVFTQIAVPQQLFYELVGGTSAAVDVCFRAGSELDYSVNPPAPMCVGIQEQCWDPTHTTLTGANCDPVQPSQLRELYNTFVTDSPDAPLTGINYLYSSTPNACSYYLTGGFTGGGISSGACASNTGPAFLMGADPWLCTPGSSGSCAPQEPSPSTFNTQTLPTTPIYSSAQATNCSLTGDLTGDLCPLDTLTQFLGGGDLSAGGTKPAGNSIYIPVVNHPLPGATAVISNLQNGWVNGSSAQVNFTASSAAYSPSANNPFPANPYNSFIAAPVYSVTYGVSPASNPVPDPTLPITTDQTVYPATSAQGFGHPLCSAGAPTYYTPPVVSVTPPADGIYNLHYYATDCALTEGLIFNPNSLTNPALNWASFPYSTFGFESSAPTFSFAVTGTDIFGTNTPATPSPSGWYKTDLTDQWTVTDQSWVAGVSGSGFAPPPTGSIQGGQTESLSASTGVGAGNVNAAAYTSAPKACDIAGYCVIGAAGGPYMIDEQLPTVTISAGSSIVGGPAITVTATCSDGAGSGIASNGCSISGTPANYVPNVPACTPAGATVTCGGTIPTTTAEGGTIYVNAADNAGNTAVNSTGYAVQSTLVLNPTSISFGTVYLYSKSSQAVTVQNEGATTVNISSVTLLPRGPAGDYTRINSCPSKLPPTQSCLITVNFYAEKYGLFTSTLDVNDNAPGSPQQVSLTTNVINPKASFSPSTLHFGTVSVGSSSTLSVTMTSSGGTVLDLASSSPISITGANQTDFSQTNSCPSVLNPGSACVISVTFTPSAKGSRAADVTVTDNAQVPMQNVSLTGSGKQTGTKP
jgi:archaellum component FlaF (FlaF/FlaG flagellin family)